MKQTNKLVYVKAVYSDGSLLQYNVEYERPLWNFLHDIEYYKGLKELYNVDDFFNRYKVIVTSTNKDSKVLRSLFICNSNDINNYL